MKRSTSTIILLSVVVLAGAASLLAVGSELTMNRRAIFMKLSRQAPDCPWSEVLRTPVEKRERGKETAALLATLNVKEYDPKLDIELVESPVRSFWIKRSGSALNGKELMADLLSDHARLVKNHADRTVRPGDIVIDCGAHVGVFTHFALQRGAAMVVSVEPDPTNLECLRRNFAKEIADRKVIAVTKGVWSSDGILTLHESSVNSGMNSVVFDRTGPGSVQIAVTTIDSIVRDLALPRVNFIKMDIEGAEREALKGATNTLIKFRPRLMLDSYHRPDDMPAFRQVILGAVAGYRYTCVECEGRTPVLMVPHVTFWE